MRDRAWVGGEGPAAPWLQDEMKDVFEGPSILRVEDDDDIRERQPRVAREGGGKSDGGQDDCPDPIELILYVSAHSVRSATAIKNITRALEGQLSGRVTLTICDLSKDPSLGQRDAVAFTPTLVRRSPGPRTFILGHITSPELVLELLEGCGES